jgi:hypothetical protein
VSCARLVCAGVLILAHALVTPAQVRDVTGAAAPAGTVRLRGRVVTPGEEPKPVRRAIVTVTGEGIKDGRSVVTDDQGGFSFAGLPAGRLMVTATKAAHLPSAYGAVQPGRPGVALQMKEGESRADVTIVMARAAAITGVVRHDTGLPASGIDIAAFRLPAPGQNSHLLMAGSAPSDDRGVYRIYDLPPGDYVVVSGVRRTGFSANDGEAWSSKQIDDILRSLQQPGTAAAPPLPIDPEGRFAYAPVYFPESSSPDGAVPMRLKAGDERTGVDFTVRLTRMATLEGVLLGDAASVTKAQFFFNATGVRLQPLLGITPAFSTRMTPAGRVFTYVGVPPGHYTVTAHVPGTSTENAQFARTAVVVTGQDALALAMTLQPAFQMSGQLVFAGKTLPPPENPGAVVVRVSAANGVGQSASGSTRMGNPLVPQAWIDDAGRFQMTGLLPETYNLTATVPGATGWWLRSAVVGGRDVLDTSFDVNGDVRDAVLTLSDSKTQLSGRITTQAGAPGDSLYIAAFPVDRALWRPQSRRITSVRADTDGRWIITGLPPGDYRIVALTDVAPGDLWDNALLEQLLPSGVAVSLADGEHKTQDLRIGGS